MKPKFLDPIIISKNNNLYNVTEMSFDGENNEIEFENINDLISFLNDIPSFDIFFDLVNKEQESLDKKFNKFFESLIGKKSLNYKDNDILLSNEKIKEINDFIEKNNFDSIKKTFLQETIKSKKIVVANYFKFLEKTIFIKDDNRKTENKFFDIFTKIFNFSDDAVKYVFNKKNIKIINSDVRKKARFLNLPFFLKNSIIFLPQKTRSLYANNNRKIIY